MQLPQNTALLLIDVQQGLDDPHYGERNNPDAETRIAEVLQAWRGAGWPVYHVQHHSTEADSPLQPGRPGVAFKPEAQPQGNEPVFVKQVHSGFIGTDLEARLRADDVETLVVAGLTTPHCVSTTTRMANNLGFTVYLLADATAAHSATGYDGTAYSGQQVHEAALTNLHGEFATVTTTSKALESFT